MSSAVLLTAPDRRGPAGGDGDHDRARSAPRSRRLRHVLRGALPAVTVATIIPITLFYSLTAVAGMRAGIIGSLTWAYLVLGRQLLSSRRVSGLLLITSFTLTIRCVTWAVHQSAFTYFAVPVAETVGMAALFVVTMAIGRPLLVSLAHDFVPGLGDRLAHTTHRRLVRHLSCVWGLVYLCSACTSGLLLATQNIHWFLLLHQFSGWLWTAAGLSVSLAYGRRHGKELVNLAMGERSFVALAA